MVEFYSTGVNRIFYKAVNFATGKDVTAYVWNPSLVKSDLQIFIEIESGLYYCDFDFTTVGSYIARFYEDSVATTFSTFRVAEMLSVISKLIHEMMF